jgi:hypothetical protein
VRSVLSEHRSTDSVIAIIDAVASLHGRENLLETIQRPARVIFVQAGNGCFCTRLPRMAASKRLSLGEYNEAPAWLCPSPQGRRPEETLADWGVE